MNFFSLDLNFYNLNISRMWLIYTLLFLKMESLLADLRIPNLVFRYSDWKTLFFNLKYLVFRSKSGFHIEKLGISIEIPGYSTEILDFSKRCGKFSVIEWNFPREELIHRLLLKCLKQNKSKTPQFVGAIDGTQIFIKASPSCRQYDYYWRKHRNFMKTQVDESREILWKHKLSWDTIYNQLILLQMILLRGASIIQVA